MNQLEQRIQITYADEQKTMGKTKMNGYGLTNLY
jgi:hypothetical protein